MNPEGKNNEDEESLAPNPYLRKLMNPYRSQTTLEAREIENLKNLDLISKHLKKFRFWEKLPMEIKCMIIKEVDFITRFSLLSCSKNMRQIAETVPVCIKSIDIQGYRLDPYDDDDTNQHVFTLLPQNGLSKNEVTVAFKSHWEGVLTHRKWYRERLDRKRVRLIENKKFSNSLKYDLEAQNFAKEVLELSKYQVDEFTVYLKDWGDDKPDFEILDKLQTKKKLLVNASDENVLKRWLDTAKCPLEELEIEFHCNVDTKCTIEHETIENAKKLYLSGVSINDSSLLNFNCEEILLGASAGITERGINTFVKRWIDGGGPDGFRRAYLSGEWTNQVLNGLDCYEWDSEFKKQNKTLHKWIDAMFAIDKKKCYYIESRKRNNGATLVIDPYRVVFLVTGKRWNKPE